MLEYRDVYAGGRLVGSGSADVITIVNPATEEVAGAVPSMVGTDVEVAVNAAQAGVRRGPVAAVQPGRTGGGPGPAGGGHRGQGRGHRPPGDGGDGHADPAVPAEQRDDPVRDHQVLRRAGPGHVHRGDARGGQLHRAHHGPARAGRRRGRGRILELPADPGVLPAGPGPGRGVHDRAQARGRDLAVRLHPGRGVRGSGLPSGRLQPGHRHRPGGGDAGGAPLCGHRGGGRADLGRAADRRDLRRDAQAGEPRARRKVGCDRAGRRRPGRDRRRTRLAVLCQRRAGVLHHVPGAGPAEPV